MPRNIVWLASYPKSGNTWVRLFLAAYLTDAEDLDLNVLAKVSPSEASRPFFERLGLADFEDTAATYHLRPQVQRAISDETKGLRFLKTHLARASIGTIPTIDDSVTARSVYVVRNPFDVAISMSHFFGISVSEAVDGLLFDQAFLAPNDLECHQFLGSWSGHVGGWLTHAQSPVLRVRYEDLLTDPAGEFAKILTFLRIEVDADRLRRAVDTASFRNAASKERDQGFRERPPTAQTFFRRGESYGFQEEMDPADIAKLRGNLGSVLQTLYPELEGTA